MTQAAPPPQTPAQSAKARLQTALREKLAEADAIGTVQIPEIAEALLDMVDVDQAWRQALLRPSILSFVREAVQREVASTRGLMVVGNQVISRAAFEERVSNRATRFENWLEHVGNKHMKLMDMTRDDLLNAANERESRGLTELRIAALERQLAEQMDDTQKVRDVFSPEDISRRVDRIGIFWTPEDAPGPNLAN